MTKNGNLNIVRDHSVSDFLAACGDLLYKTEAVNSLMVGLLEGIQHQAPGVAPLLLRIIEEGVVVSAAVSFRKQPMNIILTYATEDQLKFLAEYLLQTKEVFTGVVGPRKESEAFANIWKNLTGRNFSLAMGQKIYTLEQVIFPKNTPGEMKVATNDDIELVFAWVKLFTQESLPGDQRTDQQWREFTENVLRRGGAHLWLIDRKPVSMAMASRPTKNGISISGVYTPLANRKRGWASALVASLSQKMLDQGKRFCVLYTDTTNPTSNKIYQDIGYREMAESMHFNFD